PADRQSRVAMMVRRHAMQRRRLHRIPHRHRRELRPRKLRGRTVPARRSHQQPANAPRDQHLRQPPRRTPRLVQPKRLRPVAQRGGAPFRPRAKIRQRRRGPQVVALRRVRVEQRQLARITPPPPAVQMRHQLRQRRIRPVTQRVRHLPNPRPRRRRDVRIVAQRIRHRRAGHPRPPRHLGDRHPLFRARHLNDSENALLRQMSRPCSVSFSFLFIFLILPCSNAPPSDERERNTSRTLPPRPATTAMSSPSYFKPAADVGPDHPVLSADLCVYNANAAGVAAAVQAARDGLSVILCNPGWHVGGLTSGGLGFTDFGNKAAVGGIALEFYKRLGAHYGVEAEWRFEPHVAEKTLAAWLAEIGVVVHHGHYLESAKVEHGRIVEIAFTHGARARAKYFIDASYEGDLMAAAGVDFTVGREANATYGETLNGQQVREKHQFNFPVDPYVTPGDPASGLLPGIEPGLPEIGAGDHRVQAYNFRLCMTQREDIRVPFPKPAVYDR